MHIKNETDKQNFIYFRAKLKKDIKVAFCEYTNNAESDIKKDPASFKKYVNLLKSNSNADVGVMMLDNVELTDNISITNVFANFFSSVYS